jgi:WS/DGAT/MGAT family acyltransferase
MSVARSPGDLRSQGPDGATIDRASPADLVMLAVDTGPVPEQLGALLLLDNGSDLDPDAMLRVIADRATTIPRLRQRLVWPPAGCGRPVWIDDPGYHADHHVRRLRCPAPGDEQALLDVLTRIVTTPLPFTSPLWTAVLVTGLADGAAALIFVLHHVLADGIGGLAVLARLVDQPHRPAEPLPNNFPAPAPSWAMLVADARGERRAALSRLGRTILGLRTSLSGAGGWHAPAAAPCSLIARTGPGRRLAVARADLGALRKAAHRQNGTVNDALLAAVAGALGALLQRRGERVGTLRVTVPVAARKAPTGAVLGNEVVPLVVGLPTGGDPRTRIERISAIVRAARGRLTGPPLVVLLGPVFQAIAGLRLYRTYLNHQRRFHTLVSNVKGPKAKVSIGRVPVRELVGVSVAESGNVTVNFLALSYAGSLTVTIVAEPDLVPDLEELASLLQAELDALTN